MDMLYQAVRILAVYLMFVSVLSGILQNSPFKAYARLFAGLFLVFFLVRCLSGFAEFDWDDVISQIQDADGFERELLEAEELGGDLLKKQIKVRAEEKLREICRECGYECRQLKITLAEDCRLETVKMKVEELSGGDGNLERLKESAAAYFSLEQKDITVDQD